MREIKFRAWNKKYNIMVSWEQMKIDNTVTICFGSNDSIRELMQFTGLKDKNGAEIYEGDICKYHYYQESDSYGDYIETDRIENGVVSWKNCGWHLFGEKNYEPYLIHWCIDWIEIIGNRYENPELLQCK